MTKFKDYFFGHKISEYGRQNGYVDYATLSKCFDAVLNNDIMHKTSDIGYWEQEHGFIDHSEEIEELEERKEEVEIAIEFEESEEVIKQMEEELSDIERKIDDLADYYQPEIFQFYIISGNGAEILEEYTNEIVFYNSELDMYLWGVTHWGTSWDYVLTDIECEKEA